MRDIQPKYTNCIASCNCCIFNHVTYFPTFYLLPYFIIISITLTLFPLLDSKCKYKVGSRYVNPYCAVRNRYLHNLLHLITKIFWIEVE
jgi:hypothetical protein